MPGVAKRKRRRFQFRLRLQVVDWLVVKGYRNVLVEINNECDVKSYHHAILKLDRVHELIGLARERAGSKDSRLYVGTSYARGVVPKTNVVSVSDFLLMHGNGVSSPALISQMVRQARKVNGYRPMRVLFNEDDHYDFDKPSNNLVAAIDEYVSWGFFDDRRQGESVSEGYQSVPVNWGHHEPTQEGILHAADRDHGANNQDVTLLAASVRLRIGNPRDANLSARLPGQAPFQRHDCEGRAVLLVVVVERVVPPGAIFLLQSNEPVGKLLLLCRTAVGR